MFDLPLEVAPQFLFFFQGFEERLEVSLAETLRAFALDDFEKKRRPIFHRLGEDLQQITFVIAIDQNAEALERLEIFIDVTDPIRQRVVIGGRNIQELDPARSADRSRS